METTDDRDSVDSLLLSCSDGRRGGRAGKFWVDDFRGGNLGAGATNFDKSIARLLRVIVGIGRYVLRLAGSLPISLFCEETVLCMGTLAVWRLLSSVGFWTGLNARLLGLAVTGALPTCPRLRAAMRA